MKAAPLLVSFSSIEKYIEALPENHRTKHETDIKQLFDQGFPPVVSPYCTAVMFGYSLGFVHALSKNPSKFYRSFQIIQGEKKRQIHAPKVALKVIQKWLGFHLGNSIKFPNHVYGFVKGRSFLDAASQHIGADWVFSVDIQDFFTSISKEAIQKSLQDIGYSAQASVLISDLCCLRGSLAQGSPASPVLSNLYMMDIDKNLLEIAKNHQLKITRYADDIVFSGNGSFDEKIKESLDVIFERTGLQLNKDKIYFAEKSRGQRLKIHGLLIKEDKISLTKGYKNKIRAYQHMLNTGKIRECDLLRIKGHLQHYTLVENKQAQKKAP